MCFSPSEQDKIATTINDLAKCQEDLKYREDLLNPLHGKPPVLIAKPWWDNATIITGGIVISVSLGTVFGYMIGVSK